MIEIEFEIYRLLGVHPKVIELYRAVHRKWRWSGNNLRGLGDVMRLTGQVTTLLGNCITDM